jgi:SepF-like predicted cell division protein (DUF552 family)
MPFNLFRKKKQPEPEKPAVAPQEEEPKPEAPAQPVEIKQEPVAPPQEPAQEAAASAQETAAPPAEPKPQAAEASGKTYLKAMPLRELADVEKVKNEVKNGNIIILRVTPLANKSIEDVKTAVNDLYQFSESIGGDIARLGEERVVICPKSIRIWREKTPTPVSNEPAPTAA